MRSDTEILTSWRTWICKFLFKAIEQLFVKSDNVNLPNITQLLSLHVRSTETSIR